MTNPNLDYLINGKRLINTKFKYDLGVGLVLSCTVDQNVRKIFAPPITFYVLLVGH